MTEAAQPLREPNWIGFTVCGSEWEIEVDANASPGAPPSASQRYRPLAYTGEPEGEWLPGAPPFA